MKKTLNLILSLFALFLQGAFIHPILWRHGSSSAFDIDLLSWAMVLIWFVYSILLIYSTVRQKVRKLRQG